MKQKYVSEELTHNNETDTTCHVHIIHKPFLKNSNVSNHVVNLVKLVTQDGNRPGQKHVEF
jgi:hypothetical protein